MYGKKTENVFTARDPMGIARLYHGYDAGDRLWLASEVKCPVTKCRGI
jgi:asparagine synthetase B (glutamine-hydrolysing)